MTIHGISEEEKDHAEAFEGLLMSAGHPMPQMMYRELEAYHQDRKQKCIDYAMRGVPLSHSERGRALAVPLFVMHSGWSALPEFGAIIRQVFTAYVEHGLVDVHQPINPGQHEFPDTWLELIGAYPVQAAIRQGSVDSCELLLELGANRFDATGEMDLRAAVTANLGRGRLRFGSPPDVAADAAARLTAALMKRSIDGAMKSVDGVQAGASSLRVAGRRCL